jgi:hypothetical protein
MYRSNSRNLLPSLHAGLKKPHCGMQKPPLETKKPAQVAQVSITFLLSVISR